MQVGDKIVFDKYEWRVLDIQGNTALIITEYIIEQRPYHDAYKDITWADCSLRKYLNDEFYESFTAADQARIIPVINQNLDNQWYGSKGGVDTKDSIFLLSIEEVACRYFGNSSSLLNNPKKIKDIGLNEKMKTTVSGAQDLRVWNGIPGGGFGHPVA